ncbi:hypothetical protein LHK_02473 [Laribacter hongkongensis HLHK9]|uniref:Uncharacterized protein n=1 Tax=Laribacter hongkongensis (strain HLHK9) TaxID=557598 RepID=C1DBQ2_LARHH|nr:hypothetical protein LHK_02473 [Laribacter hongkongensis HLHK9]
MFHLRFSLVGGKVKQAVKTRFCFTQKPAGETAVKQPEPLPDKAFRYLVSLFHLFHRVFTHV